MPDRSVIIIGAGLAGLSTGCYAQMNGYRSHIFEHHSAPGGVAAAWRRKDYLIDGGIHFAMGHRPGQSLYELYRQLGVAQTVRFLDMTTYGVFFDEAGGRRVRITHDLGRLRDDLCALARADAAVIDELITGARAMQGFDMGAMGMAKPPELMGALDKLKQGWQARRFYKYLSGRYAQPVGEYAREIRDPWVRWVISNLFLPDVPVWFICMLLGLLSQGQIGLIEGGSLDFVQAIEKRYKGLGGEVTYKSTVEEILVQNDRAVGVRLADGSRHRADVVVSAADGRSTLFKMLGGRYMDAETKNRYRDWKLVRPFVMVSFGVARELKEEPWLSLVKLRKPFSVGGQTVDGIMVRIFNYSPRFAPPGKTVVQAAFETTWNYWEDLRKDRSRYEGEKQRAAAEILARLEERCAGIFSQVEVTDVATPYTTWRYTLNHQGAYEGWLPTPEAIVTPLRRALPGLRNFYMAGQWVMPGGGVPPVLYSGRHVVQILCHEDRRTFAAG